MERVVNVKQFKNRVTKYLGGVDEVVITRRGKPVALLTPIERNSAEAVLLSIGQIFRESGVSRIDARDALNRVRRRIYGSRHS